MNWIDCVEGRFMEVWIIRVFFVDLMFIMRNPICLLRWNMLVVDLYSIEYIKHTL